MTNVKIHNKQAAILVTDGFEQEEMTQPRKALQGAGAETFIISDNTNCVKGWDHTCYPSIHTDLENADAKWEDKDVVIDDRHLTSRSPKDTPAFNKAIITEFAREPQRAD
jgi:putative intracellular protease/amidase